MPGFIHVVATLSPEYMCPNRTIGDAASVCVVIVWVEIETTDQELQCYEVCDMLITFVTSYEQFRNIMTPDIYTSIFEMSMEITFEIS